MGHPFPSRTCLRKTGLGYAILCAFFAFIAATAAHADPVTYIGFTITDGRIGSWQFHNARILLTFQSDTSNVQFVQPPDTCPTVDNPNPPTSDVYFNGTGDATITVATEDRVVHARLRPNQLFVSADQGETDSAPHDGARGMGFGFNFSPQTPCGGLYPAYPLGVTDGTARWGNIIDAGNGFVNLEAQQVADLQTPASFSGRAWICTSFPDASCPTPNQALKTDAGDLFLFQPYSVSPSVGFAKPLHGGLFLVVPGDAGSGLAKELAHSLGQSSDEAEDSGQERGDISYTAFLVTDVGLGGRQYYQAPVFLSFQGDTRKVQRLHGAPSYVNELGHGSVTVLAGDHIVSAELKPNQIYAYFDSNTSSAGFGSYAGGVGYPFSLSARDGWGGPLDEIDNPEKNIQTSLIDAVGDIAWYGPTEAPSYSPATGALASATDLTHPTMLDGAASSCVQFDPYSSSCSNLAPIALKTDHGDLYIHEPFLGYDDPSGAGIPFSINWGFFWADRLR